MVFRHSIELHQEAVVVAFVLDDIVILFVLSFKLVLSFKVCTFIIPYNDLINI